ncbi:MAG: HAMP domain-containing protein [Proteobacteria bacterium]|uniref:sensor histidine kinase n=1 Tax=Rudaea sp. TaxID=2136325 RepID=UPI001D92DA32|nr:HAMP domain-containing protein [Pseudomonadota bacterium]MBS0567599.1 HAMP domain-containing protein [Pseudomonadota bacterium]
MNLHRLFRTSSFRLTLIYAAITGASFLVLFLSVFWSTTRFMQHQIDITVAAEIREVRAAAGDGGLESLRRAIEASTRQASNFFYLLQDRAGNAIAGNMPALDPVAGVREWVKPNRLPRFHETDIRGRGEAAVDGGYLFVGVSAHEVHELRESVAQSFLWGLGAAMLLVLAGGALMSASVLRRIETVSQTSRDIVAGDLQRRIPLNGSGDEFDHLAESLNAMLDRIGVLLEGLRQVSTDIAHDLRTPLTRLRQRLELAQQRTPDAQALHATLEATLADIDAILQTFGALLRIAQIESGARKASFRSVDLCELLHTVAEIYQPSIEEKSQSLHTDIAAGLDVHGDRELLTQLFANLVENASRHCAAGAHIELAARRTPAGVEVLVADDGPGIPVDMREKVLQRFVRLDASRTTPGNGLGLALAHAVAALHDAALDLGDNAPGLRVGVRFSSSASARSGIAAGAAG